jgi:hypothetical protein
MKSLFQQREGEGNAAAPPTTRIEVESGLLPFTVTYLPCPDYSLTIGRLSAHPREQRRGATLLR